MIRKFKKWLMGPKPVNVQKLNKRVSSLERRLRDFEENTTVNLYLYVDGKKITVKKDFYKVPTQGSFLELEETEYNEYWFQILNIKYSDYGFCADLHGSLVEKDESLLWWPKPQKQLQDE